MSKAKNKKKDVPAVVVPTYFMVQIQVSKEEAVQLRIADGKEAQTFANERVKEGTYTATVENGIQVFPVLNVKVTGPYKDEAANEEAAS